MGRVYSSIYTSFTTFARVSGLGKRFLLNENQ